MRFCLAVLLVFGCVADDKGPEEALFAEGKDDSHRRPTEHGAMAFGSPVFSELTATARYHAWTFELSADAQVTLTTSYAVRGQRRTDTVLYLYKEGASGWGSYIARNDDYGTTTYSQLAKNHGAGRYRALVKGYSETTYGKFKLTAMCNGPGCFDASCLFGQTYGDIFASTSLTTSSTLKVTAANLGTLTAHDQQHVVDAVKQSSHTDVTTPLEALSRVDQQEINMTLIFDGSGQRTFAAFEYGAGDNSYGAIFARQNREMVSRIHDGDLELCNVEAETCLLPEDWAAMRNDAAFTKTSTRVITSASQLNAIEKQQALDTFKRSYDDVTSVADGLTRVDGNQLNVVAFTHDATGAQLEVFEYGAGDTSVGVIYYAGQLVMAGTIDDLAIGNCTLFAAQ